MERHALQFLEPILQRDLLVFEPEESGVAQARGKHFPVTSQNQCAAIRWIDIGHGHEMRGQSRLTGLPDCKILLVRSHRGANDFRRQIEICRIHPTQHRNRPFGETGDFFQQAGILNEFQPLVSA